MAFLSLWTDCFNGGLYAFVCFHYFDGTNMREYLPYDSHVSLEL